MKATIEKPKIFISYAWTSEEYINQVLGFASQLLEDGIDVVIDKWSLEEGNDTYKFMEKCVNDNTITNVLILIDPHYAEKANNREGGVGTETQIISEQVYNNADQNKFLPVIMKKDESGNICKPTYLVASYHFDLSEADKYDEEYKKIVKKLYGIPVYEKPELGNMPAWVEKTIKVDDARPSPYNVLNGNKKEKEKKNLLNDFLTSIKNEYISFITENKTNPNKLDDYLLMYDKTVKIRDNYLQLLKRSLYVEDVKLQLSEFFEDITNQVLEYNQLSSEIVYIRIHEMFLYTIGILIKNKDYEVIGYLLSKTYFDNANGNKPRNFDLFYSVRYQDNLDKAINSKDNKMYYSGTATHWMNTINSDICSKNELILADLICFNYSIYGKEYFNDWFWFPILYVYDDRYNSIFIKMMKKMISREFAYEIVKIFGYKDINELISKIEKQKEKITNIHEKYRYRQVFHAAPTISDCIDVSLIAKYN